MLFARLVLTADWWESKIPQKVRSNPIFNSLNEIAAGILNSLTCSPNAIEFWNINKIRLFTVIDDLVLRLFQGSLHVFRKHVKFCIRLSKDMNYAIP